MLATAVAWRFTAWHLPERPTGGARTVEFRPKDYSNLFNADRPPVLTIWQGDSVHTTTIDSAASMNWASHALWLAIRKPGHFSSPVQYLVTLLSSG
jgi:hypothetical protein